MNPSTSLGTRSNMGMAKPSPLVRQAANIWRLLVIRGVYRRSVPSGCAQVKYRCRCRDNLVPSQRRAQHAGQCGVEVEDGRVPTHDWFLNLQILPWVTMYRLSACLRVCLESRRLTG